MWRRGLVGTVFALVVGAGVLMWALDSGVPAAASGPEADVAAERLMEAVGMEGWRRTGAITWHTEGRTHVWDRRKVRDRISWGEVVVDLDLKTLGGEVRRGGQVVIDPYDRDVLLAKAFAYWAEDHFWLYPFESFFDAGVARGLTEEGGLLIAYEPAPSHTAPDYDGPVKWHGDPKGWQRGVPLAPLERGLTPGDVYVWHLGPEGLPVSWEMWAAILPLGGTSATWSSWQTLSTGVVVATVHRSYRGERRIEGLRAATSLEALEASAPSP